MAQYDGPSYSASEYKSSYGQPSDYKPTYANDRVRRQVQIKIQVYRGPNKEYGKGYDAKGYDDGAFAPWYFYSTTLHLNLR